MPIPGGPFYGQFALSNPSTGVAQNADTLPTASATHNGAADASFVLTVTNTATGLYTVSGTIPSTYLPGDWVSISVSAIAGPRGQPLRALYVPGSRAFFKHPFTGVHRRLRDTRHPVVVEGNQPLFETGVGVPGTIAKE